jgi:hypothetical protein
MYLHDPDLPGRVLHGWSGEPRRVSVTHLTILWSGRCPVRLLQRQHALLRCGLLRRRRRLLRGRMLRGGRQLLPRDDLLLSAEYLVLWRDLLQSERILL